MKRDTFFGFSNEGRISFSVVFFMLLLVLSLVSASLSSTNYNIDSPVVSSGGNNASSTNYETGAMVGIISGDLSSANYVNDVGFYYSLNLVPDNLTVSLLSVDGTNKTLSDLNCSALLSDSNGDDMNVSVRWYKNSVLNLSLDYNNTYANSTMFNAILDFGNTTKSENWSCSLRTYDGAEYSGWSDSSNLTILNSLPTVTLVAPSDWSSTINRSPEFNWTGNDDDGDVLTYTFNLSEYQYSGTANCNDDILNSSVPSESYVPASDLLCLHDNGFYYNWTVRANDGEGDGNWSTMYHLNITAAVLISLTSSDMLFGQLAPAAINDTSDDSPNPFVINNDGNALTNVSVNSSALWDTQSDNSTYYQFKADNMTGEEGAFTWLESIVNWFNMPISANVVAISKLNYPTGDDSAEVDIRLEVPENEGPGAKSANILFTAELAE